MSLMNAFHDLGGAIADTAGAGIKELQRADTLNTLQQGQQQFTAGENVLNRQATVDLEKMKTAAAQDLARLVAQQQEAASTPEMKNLKSGAAAQTSAINVAAEIAKLRETARLQDVARTPEEKMLDNLYPGWRGTSTPAPSSGAVSTSGYEDTTSTLNPSSSDAASTTVPSNTTSAGMAAPAGGLSSTLRDQLISKVTGAPLAGSDAAIKYAIAQDVLKDDKFKNASPGMQAAEIENRLAIAKGTMTSPESRTAMAKAIASYQLAPLSAYALVKPGGPETMGQVIEFNPDYQESRYPEVNKAMSAFGSGKQGDITRSINVGVQHLDVLDQAANALKNNDVQALNSLKNVFMQQFGSPEPTTFDGIKQIVGTEIEKAVAGGIGASSDRDRIMKALDRANSPDQLVGITNAFRALMVGQVKGLKDQYEDATGFKTGPFAFETKLAPETIKALSGNRSSTSSDIPPRDTSVSKDTTPPGYMTPQQMYGGTGPTPTRKPLAAFMPQQAPQ